MQAAARPAGGSADVVTSGSRCHPPRHSPERGLSDQGRVHVDHGRAAVGMGRLLQSRGQPAFLANERFRAPVGREPHAAEIESVLRPLLATDTSAAWSAKFTEHRIMHEALNSYPAFLQQPHVAESGAVAWTITRTCRSRTRCRSHRYASVPGWLAANRRAIEGRARCSDSRRAGLFKHGDRHVIQAGVLVTG